MSKKTTTPADQLSPIYALIGEQDRGVTHCPHCGARGRYVRTFLCEDGTTKEAMRGCYQKWPKSGVPTQIALARSRADKALGYGRTVASWDAHILESDTAFQQGSMTMEALKRAIEHWEKMRQEWLIRRTSIGTRTAPEVLEAQRVGLPEPETTHTHLQPADTQPRPVVPSAPHKPESGWDDVWDDPSTKPRTPRARTGNSNGYKPDPKTFAFLDGLPK